MAIAVGPGFNWAQYAANGNSTVAQPGSQNWQNQMNQQIQQTMAQFRPPAAPQFQQYQPPQAAPDQGRGGNGYASQSSSVSQNVAGEDPRLTSILAQLQGQSALSDTALNDQAAQSVASQRAIAQRDLDTQMRRSLAANGLLPTGGHSERMRAELAAPIEERLAAMQEQARGNLVNQRTNTSNNLAQQLSELQRQKGAGALDQQRMAMEQQRMQQQFGMDQQRFQWEQQRDAQRQAYDTAMSQYELQRSAMENQLRTAAMQQGYNSGSGSGYNQQSGGGFSSQPLSSAAGWDSGQNRFLASGQQPRDTYNQSVERGQQSTAWHSAANNDLRAEQAQRAQQAQASRPWTSVNSGNGVSSAGSATGIAFGGSQAAIGAAGGMGYQGGGGGSSYYPGGAVGAGLSATQGILGAAGGGGGGSYGGFSSGYGQSMY